MYLRSILSYSATSYLNFITTIILLWMNTMDKDKIASLFEQFTSDLSSKFSLEHIEEVKQKYLSKAGAITNLTKAIKDLSIEEKKTFGAKVHSLKQSIESALQSKLDELVRLDLERKLASEYIDVTLPSRSENTGSLHPITQTLNSIVEIFGKLGFTVANGPEIETDFYNFKALNIPENHPARAMADTFYTVGGSVLRTHTSPIQVRYALSHDLPIKVIAPGRVYRVDMDATHSPMFHQMEGLWIDRGISFANLKAVMIGFLQEFFDDKNLQVRFRSSFFPFTEPSAEIDILSKDGKWLEVGGCGMVHPNVLQHMGVNDSAYTGFAFGIGIDRFTMLKYNIKDLRILFENDLNVLQQFC